MPDSRKSWFESQFLLTSVFFMHRRTLTANIRQRRGSKVAINLPIFIDKNTPRPFIDPTIPWDRSVFPEDAGTCNSYRIHKGVLSLHEQRRRMVPLWKITSTWMQWALAWDVAVFRSPFKRAVSKKPDGFTMRSYRSPQSWSVCSLPPSNTWH